MMLVKLAGFGPISNGIPVPVVDGGESEEAMPRPPRGSDKMNENKTKRIRKAKR